MTGLADPTTRPPRKPLKRPLLIGLLLALLGAGLGFFFVQSGKVADLLPQLGQPSSSTAYASTISSRDLAFVELPAVIVNLPRASGRTHLRFTATLEVARGQEAEVSVLTPRIIDVMNGYLRAVEPADFEDQMILSELRAQLLRRVQVVAGMDRVRDLLIIEFVLS